MTSSATALASLEAAFSALQHAEIPWVVLRGGEESVARGGDVDVLVSPGTGARAAEALTAVGFLPVPATGQEPHRFYLCCDTGPDGQEGARPVWVKLDVVDQLLAGRRQLSRDVAAAVLARRVRVGTRWHLNADDELWHRLLHQALNPGATPATPATWSGLAAAARTCGPLAAVVAALADLGPDQAQGLLDLARQDQAAAVAALRRRLPEPRRRPARGTAGAPLRRAAGRAAHAVAAVSHPHGLSVALIGPDGAGKTTLAEGLRRTLPLPSRYVYLGVWREYPWDSWLQHVVGARLALRVARLSVRAGQVRWHRARGRVVLLDRFTYDVLLPSDDLDRRGRITAGLVRRVAAQPDLVLVLDAPAEIMYARKGEHGVEELERRRASYLEVTRSHPDCVVLDAAQPAGDVLAAAQRAVWAGLGRRWGGDR